MKISRIYIAAVAFVGISIVVWSLFRPPAANRAQEPDAADHSMTGINREVTRAREFQKQIDLVRPRLEGRSEVVDQLLLGRLSLLEAAAHYRDLYAPSPEAQEQLRQRYSRFSYEEALCRQVIADVGTQLEWELTEKKRKHSEVRLPTQAEVKATD